jgi:hypothetical protein
MADLREISDQELLTAYLWAEARGEPEDGQQTVCSVMLNRVKEKRLLVYRFIETYLLAMPCVMLTAWLENRLVPN